MPAHILSDIPFTLDLPFLTSALRLKPDSRHAQHLTELAAAAQHIAHPKAAYLVPAPPSIADNSVTFDGVTFQSRLLATNLAHAQATFPFLATCGPEIETWSHTLSNPTETFWADTLMTLALAAAIQALEHHLAPQCGSHPLSSMNPGSLEDWPLTEQRPLFALLGDTPSAIGAGLNESCLITPLKSVSGIYFIATEQFINCQLCPREKCPARRAPRSAG